MIFDPQQLTQKERYKLTIGAVVPRPIAWVSTMDAAGNLNVAPFSFFTGVSSAPLILMFCPQIKPNGEKKDTLRNIEALGEFVINITNEETAAAMSKTSALLPAGESEFVYAGLTPAASASIRVPRVAEAPIAFECTLANIVTFGSEPGSGAAIFGEVQSIYIRDDLYANGYVLHEVLRPIGRLAGNHYTRTLDTFEMERG
jgi:flavin reductase (DIM6/NTAB) family NADH-FMN oxidoreductase RutF